jgi:hypothetical protein
MISSELKLEGKEEASKREYENPDVAEPVITTRAQLRSSRGAHSRDPLAHPAYGRDKLMQTPSSAPPALPLPGHSRSPSRRAAD